MPLGLPANAEQYLADATALLREHTIRKLRVTPLIVADSVKVLLERRRPLFASLEYTSAPHGYTVTFRRQIKPRRGKKAGRILAGQFDLLEVSAGLILVCSTLDPAENQHGPYLLTQRAYPLAKRPFITSRGMVRLLQELARSRQWEATAVDVMGYDRDTAKFRRDLKRLPIEEALAEMGEQGRQVQRMLVSFSTNGREVLRASFDRYGSSLIRKGNALIAVSQFSIAAGEQAVARSGDFDVGRQETPFSQKMLQLTYPDQPFAEYSGMLALCRALRAVPGLSITVVHLNPYLQAQVLDFLTGEAVEMLIMDCRSISLIPRTARSGGTLERVISSVFRYFGEASVTTKVLDLGE